MSTVQVLIELPDTGEDIENIQDKVLDALYAAGFNRIKPIGVTLIIETDKPCGCG